MVRPLIHWKKVLSPWSFVWWRPSWYFVFLFQCVGGRRMCYLDQKYAYFRCPTAKQKISIWLEGKDQKRKRAKCSCRRGREQKSEAKWFVSWRKRGHSPHCAELRQNAPVIYFPYHFFPFIWHFFSRNEPQPLIALALRSTPLAYKRRHFNVFFFDE